MVGLKNKILITLLMLLIAFKIQSQETISLGVGIKNNIIAEFTAPRKTDNILYGAGVSFFFDKGNKGKDYTGFITNFSSTYETLYAKEGSIYFLVGNKVNRRLTWLMKFGMGVTTKYLNGKGIGTLPNELWYVRQRGYNEFLCGAALQFSSDISCIKIGWDSYNSFNLGIGVNINQNN
jgi:hypothetical protein